MLSSSGDSESSDDSDYDYEYDELFENLKEVKAGDRTGRKGVGELYGQRTEDVEDEESDEPPDAVALAEAGQRKSVRFAGEASAHGRLKDEVPEAEALSVEEKKWLEILGLDPNAELEEEENQAPDALDKREKKHMKRRANNFDSAELRSWALNVQKRRNEKQDKDLRRRGMEDEWRRHQEKREKAKHEASLQRFKAFQDSIEKSEAKTKGNNICFQVIVESAENLPVRDVMTDPSPYCICSVPREDGSRTKRFRTVAVRATTAPTWNHMHEFQHCGPSDSLWFGVYDQDSSFGDLLGTAKLQSNVIYPNGFHGTLLLKDTGHLTSNLKPTLKVAIKLWDLDNIEEAKAVKGTVVELQDTIKRLERELFEKKEVLQEVEAALPARLKEQEDVKHQRRALEAEARPRQVQPQAPGTALPWDGQSLSVLEPPPEPGPAMDTASIRLRRKGLRMFLEQTYGGCESLPAAIEEITGCPVKAALPRGASRALDGGGFINYPGPTELRAVLQGMGYAPRVGEGHDWWTALFQSLDVDGDGVLKPEDLYNALVLDCPLRPLAEQQRLTEVTSTAPGLEGALPTGGSGAGAAIAGVRKQKRATPTGRPSEPPPQARRERPSLLEQGMSAAVRSELLPRILVSIVSGQGWQRPAWSDSTPYCTCEVPVPSGAPIFFKTAEVADDNVAVWNHSQELVDINAFQSLNFTVWDKDAADKVMLGRAKLAQYDFYPFGYSGEQFLEDTGRGVVATLRIEVKVLAAPGTEINASKALTQGTTSSGILSLATVKQAMEQRVVIRIFGASALRTADITGSSDPFCICEVPGKPETKFRTPVIKQDLNPKWNCTKEITIAVGDSIFFRVFDEDSQYEADMLGIASLATTKFWPGGFEGDLPLQDAGDAGAMLHVEVQVLFDQEAEGAWLQEAPVKVRIPSLHKPKVARQRRLSEESRSVDLKESHQKKLREREKAKLMQVRFDSAFEDLVFKGVLHEHDHAEAELETMLLERHYLRGVPRRPTFKKPDQIRRQRARSEDMEGLRLPKDSYRRNDKHGKRMIAAGRFDGGLDKPEEEEEWHVETLFKPAPELTLGSYSLTAGLGGHHLMEDAVAAKKPKMPDGVEKKRRGRKKAEDDKDKAT